MSEQGTPRTSRSSRTGLLTSRSPWVTAGLLALLVAVVAGCLWLAPRGDSAPGEAFGGTDAAVTQTLTERGVEPWFHPLFEPDSSEVESGLFALQAALGAGVLGFVLGNLRGRRVEREHAAVEHAEHAVMEQQAGAGVVDAGERR